MLGLCARYGLLHLLPRFEARLSQPLPVTCSGWAISRSSILQWLSTTPGFPLADVPLQPIAEDVLAGRLDVTPSRVLKFEEIRDAHRVMEANEAGGKRVVVHD
ncbi:zinc-binding dehydrogenase [Pseudomonas sp. MDT1-17]